MTLTDVLERAKHVMEIHRLRTKLAVSSADYDDLRVDFVAVGEALTRAERELTELRAVRDDYERVNEKNCELWITLAMRDQEIAELKSELGRSEDRRFEHDR